MPRFKKLILFPITILFLSFIISCDKCEFKGISTNELPQGTEGAVYSARIILDHSCDPEMVYFSHTGGTLPPGLSLSDEGWLEGTPVHEGEYSFTIKVEICFTDDGTNYGECHERTKGFYIKINPAP